MKVYTKLGDKGETSLIGGKRVVKHHQRIEAYGTIDELLSYIAVVRDSDIKKEHQSFLLKTQYVLMAISSLLAAENLSDEFKLPEVTAQDVLDLENEIDKIDSNIPQLKSFIIPGGNIAASHCHVARNICRRGERIISKLSEDHDVDELLKKYINRLSDYLFVLSRGILFDKGIEEILWNC